MMEIVIVGKNHQQMEHYLRHYTDVEKKVSGQFFNKKGDRYITINQDDKYKFSGLRPDKVIAYNCFPDYEIYHRMAYNPQEVEYIR